MLGYEVLSGDCKIRWCKGLGVKDKVYTQVSGYIFNDNNEILIVKNNNVWTIPGGHPECGEKSIDTLNREVMEEAMYGVDKQPKASALNKLPHEFIQILNVAYALIDENNSKGM